MKVEISTDEKLKDQGIEITCYEVTDRILKIKRYAEKIDTVLVVKSEQEKIFIMPEQIYYIESNEKRTFIYLEKSVWECDKRLYEIEELLQGLSLIRISKSLIVNMVYIKKIKLMINRNLELTMDNGEKIIVSRRYVKAFNQLIGME